MGDLLYSPPESVEVVRATPSERSRVFARLFGDDAFIGRGTVIHCAKAYLDSLMLRPDITEWLLSQEWLGDHREKQQAYLFKDSAGVRALLRCESSIQPEPIRSAWDAVKFSSNQRLEQELDYETSPRLFPNLPIPGPLSRFL